jgi:ATP-binding cassette subfamily G (WHITE) protein 2 (PDR)
MSRNFGIIIGFTIFYMFAHLYSTEKISAKKSKGEVLLFRRGYLSESNQYDIEASSPSKLSSPVEAMKAELPKKVSASIQRQTAVFQWKDICFDIKIKKETRRILDHIDGWVKPGTLTALMVCLPVIVKIFLIKLI